MTETFNNRAESPGPSIVKSVGGLTTGSRSQNESVAQRPLAHHVAPSAIVRVPAISLDLSSRSSYRYAWWRILSCPRCASEKNFLIAGYAALSLSSPEHDFREYLRVGRGETGDHFMWLFTRHGFFSAVCARKGNGKRGQPVDPDRIMVRARIQCHLESLKRQFPELLGDCEIREFAGTDYAFRVFVQKAAWKQVVAGLAEETDYDNFKSEVARHQGRPGAAYERSLHEVWTVMHGLQK